jgi:predicted secreted protein
MSLVTCIAVYLTIWWTALLAILPLGTRSHAEMGVPVPGGGDPSSPVEPKLRRKFMTTTWVSAILFAVLWLTIHFHWISLPTFPGPHDTY